MDYFLTYIFFSSYKIIFLLLPIKISLVHVPACQARAYVSVWAGDVWAVWGEAAPSAREEAEAAAPDGAGEGVPVSAGGASGDGVRRGGQACRGG